MDGQINMRVARCWRAGTLVAALLSGASSAALAQGITVLQSINASLGDGVYSIEDISVEWQTSLVLGTPTWEGQTASVRQQLSWLSAVSLGPERVDFGMASFPSIAWSLKVRVEDPLSQGFTLVVDSRLRGSFVALRTGNASAGVEPWGTYSKLDAMQPTVSGTPFLGTRSLPGASTPEFEARWDEITGNERRPVEREGSDTVGTWFGTQVFTFDLVQTQIDTQAIESVVAPGNAAAWQQFGRGPVLPWLDFVLPAPGDRPLEELGHFFQVSAIFLPAPIPEPGSWALLAAGLGLVVLRHRRGTASAQASGASS